MVKSSKVRTTASIDDAVHRGVMREPHAVYGEVNRYESLELRCEQFARDVRAFYKTLSKTVPNQEDGRQLIRSSGSVGANYIEANEALGRKDFFMHIKICRKEAKESRFWLRLIDAAGHPDVEDARASLEGESEELMRIFAAIFRKGEAS
jgi:four helix bundle protein